MPLDLTDAATGEIAAAQRQARIDLAAAHRLAVEHGFSEGIFNHLTLAVPGHSDRYYQIPFGLHWLEVTASCLMEVGYDGTVLRGAGEVERSAYCIHAPIHRLIPRHACVLHTHMPYASALARLEHGRLAPVGQTEIAFLDTVAYDDGFTGLAFDPAEGERLAGVLGPDRSVLFMGNHGVLVCGESVAEAYDKLYYLERACQVQLYAMWTGQKLREVPPPIVAHTLRQYAEAPVQGGKPAWQHHFDALKRLLDRRQPDYKD
ncbi:MAG TPA: class II aldolase/adducin family protein [Stellaceae bacterium]|jgi:ribulose-5-phosphate 4-epimerase/fuculose-1-phosphate aldolase|nr:class II aldolase/adducin family protein [Stellaceae bacterium]